MRILLIEDDRALCTALLPALQAAGYTVDTCHDGADGKALLCGGAYDVCVLETITWASPLTRGSFWPGCGH